MSFNKLSTQIFCLVYSFLPCKEELNVPSPSESLVKVHQIACQTIIALRLATVNKQFCGLSKTLPITVCELVKTAKWPGFGISNALGAGYFSVALKIYFLSYPTLLLKDHGFDHGNTILHDALRGDTRTDFIEMILELSEKFKLNLLNIKNKKGELPLISCLQSRMYCSRTHHNLKLLRKHGQFLTLDMFNQTFNHPENLKEPTRSQLQRYRKMLESQGLFEPPAQNKLLPTRNESCLWQDEEIENPPSRNIDKNLVTEPIKKKEINHQTTTNRKITILVSLVLISISIAFAVISAGAFIGIALACKATWILGSSYVGIKGAAGIAVALSIASGFFAIKKLCNLNH